MANLKPLFVTIHATFLLGIVFSSFYVFSAHTLPSPPILGSSLIVGKCTSKADSINSSGPTADPMVRKYIAMGLNRDAVPLAVANYGDNPPKVQEFVNGYTLLQEMGFPSNKVAEALLMYDNNTDEALAHFLNSS